MGRSRNMSNTKDESDQLASERRQSNIHSYGIIKGIMGSGVIDSLPLRVRCECSVPNCEDIIEVNLGKRRELRRNHPLGFILIPSHVNSPNDSLLSTSKLFCVVEKPGFTETVTDL